MKKLLSFLIIPLLAFPTGIGIAQTSQATSGFANVSMFDNYYSPQTITVSPGTTVTWQNMGNMNHTVTFNGYALNSGAMTPGSAFSVTFNTPGTYTYYCQFHSGMTGTVVVTNNQPSTGSSLTGTVGPSTGSGQIIIHSITPVRTTGAADGTFQNGWQWIFDISVPQNEQNFSMRFTDWLMNNGNGIIPAANNMRFYSAQSSNAYNQATAMYITGSGVYSNSITLTGNLGGTSTGMRRVQITVETRIPVNTQMGTYSTNFGLRTQ